MAHDFNKGKVQVIIPYETLVELLEAPANNAETLKAVKRLEAQISGLRMQFLALMDRFAELKN